MPDYADSYEDVSMFTLSGDRERALLDAQTECCFMWTTKAGDPVGVIMNYVATDDRFWVTCTKRRKRVAAVAARPRVALGDHQPGNEDRRQPGAHVQGPGDHPRRRRDQGVVLPGPGGTRPPGERGAAGRPSCTTWRPMAGS